MFRKFLRKRRFGAMEASDHSKNGASPKSHTIRGSYFLLALAALSASSCNPYMLLTTDQRSMIGGNLENVQLYIDRDVELSITEFETNLDKTFKGGKVNTSSLNVDKYRSFDKYLEGRALAKSTQSTIYLWVDDERNDNILIFNNFGDDEIYYLVGNKKSSDGKAILQYGGGTFYLSKGKGCRLLMKKNAKQKEKKEKKKAKGVKYKKYEGA
jgi:hypothetical protein